MAKTTLLRYVVSQLFQFFQGFPITPADGNSSIENELAPPRLALAVRIHSIETNGPPMCLRVGVYGTRGMDKTS